MKEFGMKRSVSHRRTIQEFTRGTEKFSGISTRVADITAENRIKCCRMNFWNMNPLNAFIVMLKMSTLDAIRSSHTALNYLISYHEVLYAISKHDIC